MVSEEWKVGKDIIEKKESEKKIELWMVYIRLVAQIVTNNAQELVCFFETQVRKIISLKGNQYFKTPATNICYTLLHF